MAGFAQWQQMWAQFGVADPGGHVFDQLIACYSDPKRKYHTLHHLSECFEKFEELRVEAKYPEEVELAIWFHDAIYDTQRQDNEEESAQWARGTAIAASLSSAVTERVCTLIMTTRHNALPQSTDEKILVDVDLSILGATSERFDEYERQIREEYAWVPGAVFRAKRREILNGLLTRKSIFNTRKFIEDYESKARANLDRSIKRIGD